MGDSANSTMIPIERLVIEGVKRKLQRIFNLDSPPAVITTSDRWKLAQKLQSIKDVSYPMVFLHLTGFSIALDGYNAASLNRKGVYTAMSEEGMTVRNIPLLPALFRMEIIYLTDDFLNGLRFANKVLMARGSNPFSFSLIYDGLAVDISVTPSDSIDTPDRDNAAEVLNVYEYSSTLEVRGWFSDVDRITDVAMVNLQKMTFYATATGELVDGQADIAFTKDRDSAKVVRANPDQ